ncbi:gc-rich sequence dna-binding factor 1 [Nannochloropsis gaditana]|uniref:Gc-rich sequence dna-binding factor 1 n=1 Tax=Nannochloropsis gaditana TaxID=72520 RepID=W7TSY7_9STRA|nr:gc-rich sequence dna-binding factor 1 [Nannochloropsis gaditana]
MNGIGNMNAELASRDSLAPQGAARRLDAISEADPRIDKDWESEVIRRGVRTGRGETSDGRSMALEGRGARDLSLTASLSSMALPSKGLKDSEFKSVETVLADMRSVQSRLEESHDRNSRTAEKTRSEVASVKDGLEKMQKEFGGTAARFEYFQDVRIFLSSLCGCLREKEAMVRELEAAMAQLWREGYERRMSRRVQDQEDALEEALETDGKEQQSSQAGMLLSLQGYAPEVVIALKESLSKGAGVPGPAHHDLDEFGRDASGKMSKDRRRRERRGRLASVLERINDGTGGDKAEAEATFSGAEESDSEVETLRTRQAKLLEAAGVIFEDVADEFKALDAVVQRFEDWKRKFPKDYHTAYVPIALPQVLEPYVRVEMVTWNPLGPVRSMEDGDGAGGKDVGGAAIEAFPWFERLFEYGQFQEEGSAPKQEGEDPDDRLVPQLVEKVAVSRLEGLLNECYDPFSERETQRAISAIQGLLIYEPGKHALESLLRAPFSRLEKAITKLCLPLLGPEAGISLWEFQRRQIFVALKLFRNVCFWHQVLAPRPLASLVLGVLLDGKLASALENRLDNTGRGILSKSKTVLEVIGTLEALMIATPPALVVRGDGVRLLGMGRLLDKLETRELAGPLSSTVKRVRLGFGNAIKTTQKVK